MKIGHLLALLCCMISGNLLGQTGKTSYEITVHSFFNGRPLQRDSLYLNEWGEALHWNQCRWYFSRIRGVKTNGDTVLLSNQHFLLDGLTGPATVQFTGPSPVGIKSLVIQLGVDPAVNRQGIQTGDLDPAKGMFWTWNTGYVHVKLSGTSAAAATAGERFNYDIGGYQPPHVTQRQLVFPFVADTHQQRTQISLQAEWSKVFDAQHAIRIGQYAVCHQPGALAVLLADNAAQVFGLFVPKSPQP